MGSHWSPEKGMGKGNHSNCCYGWTRGPETWQWPSGAGSIAQHWPQPWGFGAGGTGIPPGSMSPCPWCHQHHCARVLSHMGLRHPPESPRAATWLRLGVPWRVWAARAGECGERSLPSASSCPLGWMYTHLHGANEVCKGQGSGCQEAVSVNAIF